MSKLWLLPLMACQLVLIKHSEAVWDFSGSGGYCAEIYFNPRFQGPHVTLQDGEQASTLNTNNASLSFKIQEGCRLQPKLRKPGRDEGKNNKCFGICDGF